MIKAETRGSTTDLFIYGAIGDLWDGITDKDVVLVLEKVKAETINVRINSEGGLAFQGIAIMNLLREVESRVLVTVDGLAASAASVVAMAGERITMATGSMMMVHNPWGQAVGDNTTMTKMADTLEKMAENIASVYATRSGRAVSECARLMADETWMTAEDAVNEGLADAVEGSQQMVAAAWDLSRFCRPPESLQKIAASVRGVRSKPGITSVGDVDDDPPSRPRLDGRLTYQRRLHKLKVRSTEDPD